MSWSPVGGTIRKAYRRHPFRPSKPIFSRIPYQPINRIDHHEAIDTKRLSETHFSPSFNHSTLTPPREEWGIFRQLLSSLLLPIPTLLLAQFGLRTPEQDSLLAQQQRKTQADYHQMLAQLHIQEIRPGPPGNPKAPNAAHADEEKATTYTALPDPLTLKNGQKVTTAKASWQKSRPEIVEDFDRKIYGRVPKNTPRVRWEVVSTKDTMNGSYPIKLRQLVVHVDNSAYPAITVNTDLTLATAANTTGLVFFPKKFTLTTCR